MKALFSFRTLGNIHPVTQCHNPKDLAPQQHCCNAQHSTMMLGETLWHMHIHFKWGKNGNLYWIWRRKGLEMRPPWWLRNKYENNISMKLRGRECCDMKWTNVTSFTPALAIVNLLVPLPEFNVLGTLLNHREYHLGYGLDNLAFNSWQMQETFSSPKHPCQLWSPPNLQFNGYSWLFPREKSGWGMKLTSNLHFMLMLRICRATPLPPFAFMVCTVAVHRTSLQINILLWWTFHYTKGAQVLGTRSPAQLICVCCC